MAEALRAQKWVLPEEGERGFIPKESRASQKTEGWGGEEAQLWGKTAWLGVPALHFLKVVWVSGGHKLRTSFAGLGHPHRTAQLPPRETARVRGWQDNHEGLCCRQEAPISGRLSGSLPAILAAGARTTESGGVCFLPTATRPSPHTHTRFGLLGRR